jgi:hypothetical protein
MTQRGGPLFWPTLPGRGSLVQLPVEVGPGRSRGSFGLKICFFRTVRVHASAHGKERRDEPGRPGRAQPSTTGPLPAHTVTISAKRRGRNARNLSAGTEVICVIRNELWLPLFPHDSLTGLSGTGCATVAGQVDLRNLSALAASRSDRNNSVIFTRTG